MNTRNINLLVIFCLTGLITACSNSPKIQSATEDQIVIKAETEDFVDAHYKARTKCQENARLTEYSADYSEDLEIIAFNCIEIQTAEAPVEAEESEEVPEEVETATEAETTETIPAEEPAPQ